MEAIHVEDADSFPKGVVDGILIGCATQLKVTDFGPVLTRVLSGTPYFGMNLDSLFAQVDENGNPLFLPGSGFTVAAIAVATNIETKQIFGKPSKMLYDMVLNDACEKPADSLMIGDTPDTDLMGAKSVGMKTVLVWTGSLARGATTDYADIHLKGVAQFLRILKGGGENSLFTLVYPKFYLMQKLIKNSDNAVIPDLLELSVQKLDGGLKHLLESSFEPIAALDDLATNLFKNGDGMGFHLLFPMNSMENARNFFAGALSVIAPRAKVSPILTPFSKQTGHETISNLQKHLVTTLTDADKTVVILDRSAGGTTFNRLRDGVKKILPDADFISIPINSLFGRTNPLGGEEFANFDESISFRQKELDGGRSYRRGDLIEGLADGLDSSKLKDGGLLFFGYLCSSDLLSSDEQKFFIKPDGDATGVYATTFFKKMRAEDPTRFSNMVESLNDEELNKCADYYEYGLVIGTKYLGLFRD